MPLILFHAPLEEAIDGTVTDMDGTWLVALLVERSQPMPDVVLVHGRQRGKTEVAGESR